MVAVVLSNKQVLPAQVMYDPANGVNENAIPNNSNPVDVPSIITLEGMVATSTHEVQVRTHAGSVWHTHTVFDGTVATGIVEFSRRYNFVRIVRTVGADDIVTYAQFDAA